MVEAHQGRDEAESTGSPRAPSSGTSSNDGDSEMQTLTQNTTQSQAIDTEMNDASQEEPKKQGLREADVAPAADAAAAGSKVYDKSQIGGDTAVEKLPMGTMSTFANNPSLGLEEPQETLEEEEQVTSQGESLGKQGEDNARNPSTFSEKTKPEHPETSPTQTTQASETDITMNESQNEFNNNMTEDSQTPRVLSTFANNPSLALEHDENQNDHTQIVPSQSTQGDVMSNVTQSQSAQVESGDVEMQEADENPKEDDKVSEQPNVGSVSTFAINPSLELEPTQDKNGQELGDVARVSSPEKKSSREEESQVLDSNKAPLGTQSSFAQAPSLRLGPSALYDSEDDDSEPEDRPKEPNAVKSDASENRSGKEPNARSKLVSPFSNLNAPNPVLRGELGAAPRSVLTPLTKPLPQNGSSIEQEPHNTTDKDTAPERQEVESLKDNNDTSNHNSGSPPPLGPPGGGGGGGGGEGPPGGGGPPGGPPPPSGMPNESGDATLEQDDSAGMCIFGTSINVMEQMALFRDFCQTFTLEGHDTPYYIRLLHEIQEQGELEFDINCEHLQIHSEGSLKLYRTLIQYPTEMIPVLDLVIHDQFVTMFGEEGLPQSRRIQVRTFNLHKLHRMRALDPEDLEQMVTLRGMIVRVSPVIPDLKQAFFRCTICNHEAEVLIDRGQIQEPKRCERCNKKLCMRLVHNRSLFSDKQMIKLQEAPENIPEGETPHTISIYAYDTLVDVAKPGDRVEVTGVFKAVPTKRVPTRRVLGSTYKTYLDVLHVRLIEKGNNQNTRSRPLDPNRPTPMELEESFNQPEQDVEGQSDSNGDTTGANALDTLTDAEREAIFREMASDPGLYEKLAHAVAPSIWELDDIKKGVLLLLLGGTNKEVKMDASKVKSTHRMRSRGEINVLLCGDPGTSKSQILSYVNKLAPRGIYTSGKGSSAVGLTAYVTKDPDSKELILESGALVLSDRGVCCIDEFDKMSDTTRGILHECMEQQTISIAKAGIIATLNARTSILASANPIESRYNPKLSIVQNIQLPPTLLSRFDLIYLVLDKPDVATDRRLAKHLVSLYFKEPTARKAAFNRQLVTEYIAFAKETCSPQLRDSAVRKLVQGYVDMRQVGALGGGKKTISATPRQLESLIRLSEAHAKLRLSDHVEESDVTEALRLMHVATQRSAVDPRTGTIDMDAIATGVATSERNTLQVLAEAVYQVLQESGGQAGTKIFSLAKEMQERSSEPVTQEMVMGAVQILMDDDKVDYQPRAALVRLKA